jgi:hypothetical protein
VKKKQPSNVFTMPSWMKNLRVREPEGTYTPDQVAAVLELNLLLNGSVESLRDSLQTLVPLVPLKHQKVLKAFLVMDDSNLLTSVNEFITKVNASLVQIMQEKTDVRTEQCAEPSGESANHDGHFPADWGDDDWGSTRGPKPSTRGLRALRASKRGQAEA